MFGLHSQAENGQASQEGRCLQLTVDYDVVRCGGVADAGQLLGYQTVQKTGTTSYRDARPATFSAAVRPCCSATRQCSTRMGAQSPRRGKRAMSSAAYRSSTTLRRTGDSVDSTPRKVVTQNPTSFRISAWPPA